MNAKLWVLEKKYEKNETQQDTNQKGRPQLNEEDAEE